MTEIRVLSSGSITQKTVVRNLLFTDFSPLYSSCCPHKCVLHLFKINFKKKSMLCFNTRESQDDFIINKGKSESDSSSKLVTTEN